MKIYLFFGTSSSELVIPQGKDLTVSSLKDSIIAYTISNGFYKMTTDILEPYISSIAGDKNLSGKVENMFVPIPGGKPLPYSIPESIKGYWFAVESTDNVFSILLTHKASNNPNADKALEYRVQGDIEESILSTLVLSEEDLREFIDISEMLRTGIYGKKVRIVMHHTMMDNFKNLKSEFSVSDMGSCSIVKAEANNLNLTITAKKYIGVIHGMYDKRHDSLYKTFLTKYTIVINNVLLHPKVKYLGFAIFRKSDTKNFSHTDDTYQLTYTGMTPFAALTVLATYAKYIKSKTPKLSAEEVKIAHTNVNNALALLKDFFNKYKQNLEDRDILLKKESLEFMKQLQIDFKAKIGMCEPASDNFKVLHYDSVAIKEDNYMFSVQSLAESIYNISDHDLTSVETLFIEHGTTMDDNGLIKNAIGKYIVPVICEKVIDFYADQKRDMKLNQKLLTTGNKIAYFIVK